MTSDTGIAAVEVAGSNNKAVRLTNTTTTFSKSQYTLLQLNASTYGFTAKFTYAIRTPGGGAPWAEGFGFYLKPEASGLDPNNQVGGYGQGLGVEFVTFGAPRHLSRVNGEEQAPAYGVAPMLTGFFVPVVIDFRTAPGQTTGRLTVTTNGQEIFRDVPVSYVPNPTDLFVFAARTGLYMEDLYIDDIEVTPYTRKPASNLTIRQTGESGSILLMQVKWDTEPGGIYDMYTSFDLRTWNYAQTYTAAGSSQAITSIVSPAVHPQYFYRVERRQ